MSRVILGGGLGGLSAAYYLAKTPLNHSITLIEASQSIGGWIKSHKLPSGAIFEQGPRTIRPRGDAGENTLKLIEELGLSNKIVPIKSDHPAAQNRMIYACGGLHKLPSSFGGLLRRQDPFSKPLIFHLLNDLTSKSKSVADEPIYDFIERRFGGEVADFLISPLICGICAGNAKEISVKFLMKQLFEYEQQYGNITKGVLNSIFTAKKEKTKPEGLVLKAKKEKWNIYSFVDGCETLPAALHAAITAKNVKIMLDSPCKEISIETNKVSIKLQHETVEARHVISAIPAPILGTLIQNQHPELAQLLTKLIKNVSVAVINLHFNQRVLNQSAFGLLVAPKEQLPILGVIFDSCCFPKSGSSTELTVMMGGYWFEHFFGTDPSEDELLTIALKYLQKILQINDYPTLHKVNILRNCLPQYIVGHEDNLCKINEYLKRHNLPLSLCGASYYGVGINDVIVSAKNAAADCILQYK